MLLNILLTLLIIVGISLTGLVLLQRSEGGALGMGGGGGGQLVSARSAANFLTKSTWWIGIVFFVLSLSITVLLGRQAGSGSITDRMKIESLDPAKMAADQKAMIDDLKARDAAKGAATPGLPAPSGGIGLPAPSAAPNPFAVPAPSTPQKIMLPAPAPVKAPAPTPKTAPAKAPAPAVEPAAPPVISLPTPTPPAE